MTCVPLSRNPRCSRVALVACVTVFAVGCHSGVETPVSPSVSSAPLEAASAADIASDSVVAALAGGPLSFAMDEVDGSGSAGTCTLGTGGSGFRIKASGNGNPNTTIRFILQESAPRDPSAPQRYTDFAEVDQRGSFRTGQDRVTFLPSGLRVECVLMAWPADTVLARGAAFDIP